MRTEYIDNINFQGKLVVVNNLSNKPSRCVKKVQYNINALIKEKDYNLYIRQLYDKNEISIYADYPFPLKPEQRSIMLTPEKESLPINANFSRYIDAAKNAIEKYDRALLENKQQKWELSQKKSIKQKVKDIAETILFLPLYAIDDILHEINPKWSKKFEKFIDMI